MSIDLKAASFVFTALGFLVTIILGSMWLGELSNSVAYLKETSVPAERIARIEARLDALVAGQERLVLAVDSFARRENRDGPR